MRMSALLTTSTSLTQLSPKSPKKPPPLGVWRNRRVERDDLMEISSKIVEKILEKKVQFKQRENRFRHSSKALVEKCGNVGMTYVEWGAVMPLMFRLPKGESSSVNRRDSFEPRIAQKRTAGTSPRL